MIRQHHSLVVHKDAPVMTMSVHHTISNIPVFGKVHMVSFWVMEGVKNEGVRIRVFHRVEGLRGVALSAVGLEERNDG